MKIILIICLSVLSFIAFSQENKSYDINEILNDFEEIKFKESAPLIDWIEGQDMLIIYEYDDFSKNNNTIIALNDSTPVCILSKDEDYTFYIDTDGDLKTDVKTDYFFLPKRIIKNNSIIDSSDVNVLNTLNTMYEKSLQSNTLEITEEDINNFNSYKYDTNKKNRHIIYLIDIY